jgi:hypothetical protein
MKSKQVLDIPMEENDAGAETIRGYLKALLASVWIEEEGFSGKRPFGNSGWKNDVCIALVKAGAVAGKFDHNGYLEECDREKADQIILDAIEELQ